MMCAEHETLMDTDVPAVLEVMATDHMHDCDDTTHHDSLMKIKPINFSIHIQVNLELLEINNKYYNYSRIHVKKEIAITVLEAF